MSNNPWTKFIAARVESLTLESRAMNEIFNHETIKGNIRELFVKLVLEPFLPPNIGIGTGEIINHLGHRSRQLDVVLYNRHRVPPILVSGIDTGIFPWESVIAVIEVKSRVTTQALYDAHINSNSICSVYEDIPEDDVQLSGKRPRDSMSYLTHIPYILFGFDSDLKSSIQNDFSEIQIGIGTGYLGKEGIRLIKSYRDLVDKRTELEGIINNKAKEATEVKKAKTKYSELGGASADLRAQRILSICLAGREWCTGNASFSSEVFSNYGNDPIRVGRFGFSWEGAISQKFDEVQKLLHQIIELSHEMPKCREHYNLSRYLA